MKAVMNTKSNYKNCNGIKLEVVECKGTRISCYVPYGGYNSKGLPNVDGSKPKEHNRMIIADFSIKEVAELYS